MLAPNLTIGLYACIGFSPAGISINQPRWYFLIDNNKPGKGLSNPFADVRKKMNY